MVAVVDERRGRRRVRDSSRSTSKKNPAVGVDVVEQRRGEVGGGLVVDVGCFADVIEGIAHVHGVPEDHGVGDDGQAEGLLGLALVVAVPNVPLVGKEQLAAQGVQRLALIELAADPPP